VLHIRACACALVWCTQSLRSLRLRLPNSLLLILKSRRDIDCRDRRGAANRRHPYAQVFTGHICYDLPLLHSHRSMHVSSYITSTYLVICCSCILLSSVSLSLSFSLFFFVSLSDWSIQISLHQYIDSLVPMTKPKRETTTRHSGPEA